MRGEHTKGPWVIEPQGEGARGYWLHDADGQFIAMSCKRANRAEEDANAALIQSAPDLLEALENCLALVRLKYGNLDEGANAVQEQARAALLRARGEAK